MANLSNDENNIKDLENSNNTGSPDIKISNNNKSKNFLPSFLLDNTEKDDYFNDQSSNDDNESNEDKDIIDSHNNKKSPEIWEEQKEKNSQHKYDLNKLPYQEKNKYLSDNNIMDNNEKNKNERIIFNNEISNNNNRNIINNNYYYSLPINNSKNFINNSFNNRNSNYYYQNYFNLQNNNNINSNVFNNNDIHNKNNITNNNINNINNNILMNQNTSINPFSNSFGPVYPYNLLNLQPFFSGPIKQNNSTDKMNNNFNYNISKNELNKKCFSFNAPFSQTSSDKKKKKKPKKDKRNEDNINDYNVSMEKLLNMADYSLYNYLITQKGSREVQTVLKKAKENEVDLLIDKLKKYISDITIDKYGNYFSQKLIQICVPSQRIKILENINNRFVEIANNSYGTHPLQTLMEIINMPEEKKIVLSYILGNESALSLDSKGTHVLQKYISNSVDAEREQLNKNIINLIDKLIVDQFGVCVLIKLVKHTKDKIITKTIANYITENDPLSFIQHPYANYAVQILINSTDLSYCENIIDTIVNNYLSLSMQKFSSNVVENCIKYGDENCVKKIYKAIIEQEKLESLLNNNYGNFVLEKLIARLNKDEKMKIIKKIEKLGKTKNLSNTLKNLLYE